MPRTKVTPCLAVKFEAGEENRIVYKICIGERVESLCLMAVQINHTRTRGPDTNYEVEIPPFTETHVTVSEWVLEMGN